MELWEKHILIDLYKIYIEKLFILKRPFNGIHTKRRVDETPEQFKNRRIYRMRKFVRVHLLSFKAFTLKIQQSYEWERSLDIDRRQTFVPPLKWFRFVIIPLWWHVADLVFLFDYSGNIHVYQTYNYAKLKKVNMNCLPYLQKNPFIFRHDKREAQYADIIEQVKGYHFIGWNKNSITCEGSELKSIYGNLQDHQSIRLRKVFLGSSNYIIL